ncbi:unnamed protein product [Amoebophrya sp. A120]|nr:unnamed protein product [Amoebophrya sp. A120]|eukprot:GSA120T00006679001.1
MPKVGRSKTGAAARHDPLSVQLENDDATRNLRTVPRKKPNRTKAADNSNATEGGEDMLDSKMTRKVLDSIAAQRKEDEDEGANLDLHGAREDAAFTGSNANEEDEVEDLELQDEDGFLKLDSLGVGQLTAEEEAALQMFLPPSAGGASSSTSSRAGEHAAANKTAQQDESGNGSTSLADIVMQQLKERTEELTRLPNEATESTQNSAKHKNELSPKVIQVYTEIGKWLKTYKSGKMPKPFLVIPSLTNWEEVLCLTNPLDWSPNAMREAVKIFASQLNAKMAQRFFNLVLLPAVRSDMVENKKLNFHYYECLKKAMFKPAAFMKGILLPLALESCTLREAHIVCSVLGKISVPVLHASASLVRLAEFSPWYGTTAMFMAVLINKKYSLPYSVIDKLVDHFYSFLADERELPLVWHRCLLIFVQRYKGELNGEQRLKLKQLLKVHCHEKGIGQEVKRELLAIAMSLREKDCGASAMETEG